MSANKQKHPFHLGATRKPGVDAAHVVPGQATLHMKGEANRARPLALLKLSVPPG
jgi:hypothetical protein